MAAVEYGFAFPGETPVANIWADAVKTIDSLKGRGSWEVYPELRVGPDLAEYNLPQPFGWYGLFLPTVE